MKQSAKIKKLLLGFIMILFFGGLIFTESCRKDRSMTLTIIAKMMADTNVLVPNAKVILNKDDVHVEGYTDGQGEFRHTFNLQIQLDVSVTKDTLSGMGIVNLGKTGIDIEKSIYIF